MKKLIVDLADRSYPIYIGHGLLDDPTILQNHIYGDQVLIVSNTLVGRLYGSRLQRALSETKKVDYMELPDGEVYKNLSTLNTIFDCLLGQNHNRTTTLVALGGGVVGDMVGFAAACYQRGVRFIQVPTTLLSQVDSSVGGKTGVNHALGKNMIGAFYQPEAVLIDVDLLQSLPARELSAGLAEVIKYGLIADKPFFEWLESHVDALVAKREDELIYAIARSCETKANIVSADEHEQGIRAILNLGHTFGHAIEASQGYGNWLHGEAVAAGMVMACDLSVRQSWVTPALLERSISLIDRAGLPTQPPASMSSDDFMKYMAVDKKVLDGQLRLVLLRGLGDAVTTCDFDHALLRDVLSHRAVV